MCVTQELDDLLSSPVLKESVIANCDCRILLDMRKYANKFDEIQELLGLSDKERNQVLSINRANDPQAPLQRGVDRTRRRALCCLCYRNES